MVGGEQAEGGEGRGGAGDEDTPHAEQRGVAGGVDGTHAAEGDEVELAGVGAGEGEDASDGVAHVGVDDGHGGHRRLFCVEAQRLADGGQGLPRPVEVEVEPSAPERGGVEATEHQVGVGHGGLGSAAPVAHRPGMLPADSGPTVSVPARLRLSDPPPAPMEWTSTIGRAMQ